MASLSFDKTEQHLLDFAAKFGWNHHADADINAQFTAELGLSIGYSPEPKMGRINVDFASGALTHRRKFGGGKGQTIVKAIGLKKEPLKVMDATAGLGRDAFVFATMGCDVTMVERHPVVAALLQDGLQRGQHHENQDVAMLTANMRMHFGCITELTTLEPVDVVYLDPMYPHKAKSALVKKEMRVFQHLVGPDLDADKLLASAKKLATKRVVVKRPSYAEPLAGVKPDLVFESKKNRFDVYLAVNF